MHAPERLGPHGLPAFPGGGYDGEGLVEMRDSGNVPVVTGKGAREDAWRVVGEIGDDYFNDLQGEPGSRCRRSPRISAPSDFGEGSVPSSFDE